VLLEKIELQEPVLVLAMHHRKKLSERHAHCPRCVLETVIQFIKDAFEDSLATCSQIQNENQFNQNTTTRGCDFFLQNTPTSTKLERRITKPHYDNRPDQENTANL
jgi:transcription elongation factor Elf1